MVRLIIIALICISLDVNVVVCSTCVDVGVGFRDGNFTLIPYKRQLSDWDFYNNAARTFINYGSDTFQEDYSSYAYIPSDGSSSINACFTTNQPAIYVLRWKSAGNIGNPTISCDYDIQVEYITDSYKNKVASFSLNSTWESHNMILDLTTTSAITITFKSRDYNEEYYLLLSGFEISIACPDADTFNGNFNTHLIGFDNANYIYVPYDAYPYDFTQGAALANTTMVASGSNFWNNHNQDGIGFNQYAVVQGYNSFKFCIVTSSPANYTLMWKDAGRGASADPNYGNHSYMVEVTQDGESYSKQKYPTMTDSEWNDRFLQFNLNSSGMYYIKFSGVVPEEEEGEYGDRSSFVGGIKLNLTRVPLLTTAGMTTRSISAGVMSTGSITTGSITTSSITPPNLEQFNTNATISKATPSDIRTYGASAVIYNSSQSEIDINHFTSDVIEKASRGQCGSTPPLNCKKDVIVFRTNVTGEFQAIFTFSVKQVQRIRFGARMGGKFLENSTIYIFLQLQNNDTLPILEFPPQPANVWSGYLNSSVIQLNSSDVGDVKILIHANISVASQDQGSGDVTSLNIDTVQLEYQQNGEDVSSSEPSKKTMNLPLIIGIAAAAFVVLVIGVILAIILIKKQRKEANYSDMELSLKSNGMKEITDVTIKRKIGKGNFGAVYHGTAYGGTTDIALKKLNKEAMNEFLREARITDQLRHPNCLYFMGIYVDPSGDRFLVTEFCNDGSLLDHLQPTNKAKFLKYALEASKGMAYLESQNIVHRDLACRNLLVHNDVVKVADFGLSGSVLDEEENEAVQFPIRWSSIEVLSSRQFSSKSDTWAMGIVLYEMFTFGEMPYKELSNAQVVRKVQEGHRLSKPKEMREDVWSLVTRCWKEDPSDRPTLAEVASQLQKFM